MPTAAPTETGADDLRDLGLPFEALPRALVPPLGRASSREIRAPLRRHEPSASTPGSKLPSARRCDAPHVFRPRGFSPPRRFAPHTVPRACCIPQPARGSSRFRSTGAGPVLPDRSRTDTVADLRAPSPRRRVHTLRRVSSSTAGTASPRSVAFLSLPALVPPRPQPKPRHARWVLASQEPRGHRRPEPGRPAGTGHRLDTVKLRSAANGGPPRHRVVRAPANRCAARADRPVEQRRSADERAVESRAKRHARTAHCRWATREHPRAPRAPSDGRDRQTTALHARHAEASRADSSRRRERPTSGPCSVDESVVLRRRCRRTNTRSFHGLCSPPRSTRAPLQPGPCRDRADTAGRGPGARDADRGLRPVRHRWDPSDDCPSLGPREAVSETSPGAEADQERRAFSARRPRPGCVPRTLGAAEAVLEKRGGVAGVCPEARS